MSQVRFSRRFFGVAQLCSLRILTQVLAAPGFVGFEGWAILAPALRDFSHG
jgi:hypothetical protein